MTNIKINLQNGKSIKLALDETAAPITVENFLHLIDNRFFDGLCFHRCIDNFMIQGGGFFAEGRALREKNGAKTIKGEFSSNGVRNTLKHEPGVISMARTSVPDSASSQFFICSGDCSFLDGQYAAFGKTIDKESLDVVYEIAACKTHGWAYYEDIPDEPVVITTVERI